MVLNYPFPILLWIWVILVLMGQWIFSTYRDARTHILMNPPTKYELTFKKQHSNTLL